MELVLDANILVAGFLRSAVTRELLLDERLKLWAPEHALTETESVLKAPRLRQRVGRLSEAEVQALLAHLTSRMEVLPFSSYQPKFAEAERIAPHPEDVPYLAVALHLGLPLWSNDSALKEQNQVPVYTTREVLILLRNI